MPTTRPTYPVDIANVHRELPLFEIKPGLKIAILNILGDTELVEACARALGEHLEKISYDVLVTAEAKSIPLAHALSVVTGKPYVILRKSYKPYMGDALQAETLSITTGQPQTLYLRRRAGLDDLLDAVLEREEGVRADRGAAHVELRLHDRGLHRLDAARLAAADRRRAVVLREHDGVRLHVLDHLPAELQRRPFLLGWGSLRPHLGGRALQLVQVRRLRQVPAADGLDHQRIGRGIGNPQQPQILLRRQDGQRIDDHLGQSILGQWDSHGHHCRGLERANQCAKKEADLRQSAQQ